MFTLELLHVADQEGSGANFDDIPRLSAVLNALEAQDLGDDGQADNTLVLSSGDAFLPGLFFDASETVYGTPGIADIQIQNELGFEAMAFGNHEFDAGTELLGSLIRGDAEGEILGADFAGAAFPYLTANLDVTTDANLADLAVAGGGAAQANTVTSSVVLEEGGELIGVVGATTPTLAAISSPDDVTISPADFAGNPSDADLDALAAIIQAEVDALLAANPGMNKVILLGHMQQIAIETGLAERLENVDIIVAGGSNTRLFDEDDRIRPGDTAQGEYPTVVENAGGTDTLVVNTDGNYTYVGRLVIDFDDDGNILPDSYDPAVSGAYATDDQGVEDLGAGDLVDPEVAQIVSEVQGAIVESESNVFGISDVFLNANRSGDADSATDPDGVRTQETNLGNLTADANLAIAQEADPTVVASLKNGGGIRASIGEATVPPGGTGEAVRTPNSAVTDADGNLVKPEGGISETDIARTLAFNNDLTLLTLTRAELAAVLEHAVGDIGGGRFPQLSGIRMSYDASRPEGARVENAVIVDDGGETVAEIVTAGEIAGDPAESFRIVTLGFLAGGGDGYPFPQGESANRVDLEAEGQQAGAATFADDGTEQDVLAEYLAANFASAEMAFDQPDLGRGLDARIQNLEVRSDTVTAPTFRDGVTPTIATVFQGESDPEDEDSPEGASEVVAHEDGVLYVTNGNLDRIDVFDIAAGAQTGTLDLAGIAGFDGVQSVAVKNGLVAAAVEIEAVADGDDLVPQAGVVAFFDAASGELIDTVEVGVLPDAISFTPDGTKLVVANEGEFNSESDVTVNAPGSISVIDVTDTASLTATTVGFEGVDASGARLFPGIDPLLDLEPEYVAITPDSSTAFVSLQEANAFAIVDLAAPAITGILPAGEVDHSVEGFGFDATDNEVIDIAPRNTVGMRMPDSAVAFEIGGTAYLAGANEGDGRGDAFDDGDPVPFGDEARVGELLELGLIDESVDTEGLDRLIVSAIDGDTDGDGDIDQLHSYGSRSFTIWDTQGNVVFDSGNDFEEIIANVAPERFLDDDGELGQNRADAKGVEPEAIEIGQIGQQTFAFIGLERDSGVMVYNISQPENARFETYIDGFESGNLAPEIIEFIPEAESTSGTAQIAVSYEVTGTTAVYDLARPESDVTTEEYFTVALGRDVLLPGFDFWSDILDLGNVERIVAEAFDTSDEFQGLIEGLTDEAAIDLVFNNARGRDATEAEQAAYQPVVAEDGFDSLFFDLVNSDDPFLA